MKKQVLKKLKLQIQEEDFENFNIQSGRKLRNIKNQSVGGKLKAGRKSNQLEERLKISIFSQLEEDLKLGGKQVLKKLNFLDLGGNLRDFKIQSGRKEKLILKKLKH